MKFQEQIYVVDQKTTGSTLSNRWFDQWKLSGQMSGYTLAGKVAFDLPAVGVMIDAVQVAVGFSRYFRGFTYRTDEQLEEWHQETLHYIAEARRAFQSSNFPRNTASCFNYGGCQFLEVCASSSDRVREQFLKADFEQDRWNPMEAR